MSTVIGIGIDLTQHVPLVTVAVCPPGMENAAIDAAALVSHWPPKVELRGQFCPQPPVALLPVMRGEPLLVGDAAASHRRSAGFAWPPEAQVPFGKDTACGVARIPLVAAWASLLPQGGTDFSMTRREDHEFKWCPDGPEMPEHAACAGDLIARSIKAFLTAANVPIGTCLTAIVVPDALDEAGQQILLDSLTDAGIASDKVHLLPRPLAVALHWCQNADSRSFGVVAGNEEDGEAAGRLRVLTMGLDLWEVESLELRARRHDGRVWLVPIRDRARLAGALPELQTPGVSFALALARAESNSESFGWWHRLFSGDWLNRRLGAGWDMTQVELQMLRAVRSANPPDILRREFAQLATLQPLWARFFQSGPPLLQAISERWAQQEQRLSTNSFPCRAILADGSFACLRMEGGVTLAKFAGNATRASTAGHEAAARGAALAAAAIGHGLPCYRERLLPLDLYVMGRDEYDDPSPQWKPLVAAQTVEAGLSWRTREPVTGLQIRKAQDRLLLPLRRSMRGSPMFRQVGTELTTPAKGDEPVRIEVEVKPGQGFARVRIDSVTPDIFSTRLDWRTMQKCDEPKPPPLAYLPGVSRILPDRQMFDAAQGVLESALAALEKGNPVPATERVRDAIKLLNKWPLAHNVERNRGRATAKDFMLHYGVIGSEGKLDDLRAPGLARRLRNTIGERFKTLLRSGKARSQIGSILLRAGGWFYLAMPDECRDFLRSQLKAAESDVLALSGVDLHAIGLGIDATEDLRRFFPLVVEALRHAEAKPNNWLRAVRNICRFRNHALHTNAISDTVLMDLVDGLFDTMRTQISGGGLGPRIFGNCLESIPFLLKRRRYNPDFLAPDSRVALQLIRFLEQVDQEHRHRLPTRLKGVPKATLNFLSKKATSTDLEQLLGLESEDDDD
jgi:hypothetical protein